MINLIYDPTNNNHQISIHSKPSLYPPLDLDSIPRNDTHLFRTLINFPPPRIDPIPLLRGEYEKGGRGFDGLKETNSLYRD